MKWIALLFWVVLAPLLAVGMDAPEPREGFRWEALGKVAIQERGRYKPLDTFALETVQFITGSRHCGPLSAMECLFGWILNYEKDWEGKRFIRIDYKPLKEKLGLPIDERYFSPETLKSNASLGVLARQSFQKQQMKERLDPLEKKAVDVQNQLAFLQAAVAGDALTIFPVDEKSGLSGWVPLSSINASEDMLPYSAEQKNQLYPMLAQMVESFRLRKAEGWNVASENFADFLRNDIGGADYPSLKRISLEIHYNHLRPFRLAWWFYLGAFIFLVLSYYSKQRIYKWIGGLCLLVGFGVHGYGFGLRCYISGHPPVTNMYESVIWVSWGCLLFSLLIWLKYRHVLIPAAACVFSIVALVLADNAPIVLDPSIHPIEPVLRSNFWLTIHVLTITLSYAAFALSLCFGNVVLGQFAFRKQKSEMITHFSLYMYRAMQIGVVLLAAGTILGGVWADYSWGRFWGWDPKEVWALVALLFYLAVLHGRFTGWLRGFGFVAATVMSFDGVLMAWYGVNFVLGAGLHSYGFGAGGMGYVVGYLVLQIGFILFSYYRYKRMGKVAQIPIEVNQPWRK